MSWQGRLVLMTSLKQKIIETKTYSRKFQLFCSIDERTLLRLVEDRKTPIYGLEGGTNDLLVLKDFINFLSNRFVGS